MKKIKLFFAAALSMIAWTGVMAQTAAEYEAALAAITDGAKYRISTDVSGTKYYVTAGGTLTDVKAKGDAFTFAKVAEGGEYVVDEAGTKAVGIQLTSSANTRFTNAPLSDSKAVLSVSNYSTTTDNRPNWESQVFFLNENGKYAIRSCNTAYAESSWQDAGRTFWTYTVDPVDPEYTYDPAYVWELESYTETPEQQEALAKVQAWPVYVQSAAGLVKDASKFYSNAKESSEGSYEALVDDDYSTFFHSAWSAGSAVDEDHYLQAELSEATQKFEFYFKKRQQNNNNRPTTIVISASNDGENFTEITTLDSGFPTDAAVIDYFSDEVDLGAKYKYVRFTVTATNNGATNGNTETPRVFFTFSEFYLFPEAAAQLAPIYNAYCSALAGDLTAEDVAQINTVDMALKSAISTVTVTYVLTDGAGSIIDTKEVVQKPYSDVEIPTTWASNSKFFDYVANGTIGDTDCTITVVRTLKAGYVGALAQLSNAKAYNVICDRGAMLTNGETIASTSSSDYASAEPGQFAFINYENKYYLYSVADGKFVANNGYLVEKPSNGVLDAIQMTPKTVPYFFFYYTTENGDYGVNTNGTGALGGIVINSWMNADQGNQYYMVEAADFDATAAIAALDAQFHPAVSVVYVVKDQFGNTIFTSDPEPADEGATITELPEKYHRTFYTYRGGAVTVTEANTEYVVTAIWNGPFEISENFENAHWYDMAMRGTWYVTSAVKDGDGAYKTQNANTMGLVEDSYHWAFVGDGYNGFKIFNKAEGADKSFGWTDATATNAGIPTIMDNAEGYHAWKIVASTNTSVPANSFCLNVPGTNLYINQYGGAGGSVKFWNSANNVGDAGSAFTVFDIPTNFASYVEEEISPALDATGYFAFTDAAKAAIGYDESKKTECSFEEYKSMKENMATAMGDIKNFILPETGVYLLTNKLYGTLMGIDPSDAGMWGNYAKIKDARNYVTLTKVGEKTYTISLMGKYAPATVAQSTPVVASTEAGTYTVVITTPGYAAFQADTEVNMSCLHRRAEGDIVGWEPTADASMWAATKATGINLTVGEAGYATAYLPFAVEVGQTISVPAAIGTWTFDDPSNLMAGTGVATMHATDDGVAAVEGVEGVVGGAIKVAKGAYLKMETGINTNELGTYTIMMDVNLPDDASGRFSALFQNKPANDGDASFFIYNHKTNGRKVGVNAGGLGYVGSIDLNTWYRIVFSCENSIPTVYVNGVKVGAATTAVAEHWTLKDVVLFFADNDGEENEILADEIRFWDVALTADEVGMLGSHGDVIPEPTTVAAFTAVINNTWLDLVPVEGTIPAYTPVILKGDAATYEFAIPAIEPEEVVIPDGAVGIFDDEVDGSKALVKEAVWATPFEENVLKGTLEPIEAVGKYVLAKPEGEKVGFYLAESGTIAAGKAYLELNSDVKAFYFNFGDDPTGVANVEKAVENGLIYNIAGQRIGKMQKGINIVNGKKILK